MKKNWKGSCVICQDIITNPICPECKANELEAWFAGENNTAHSYSFRRLAKSFSEPHEYSTTCVICKKATNICSYCFLELVNIKEEAKQLIREFTEIT